MFQGQLVAIYLTAQKRGTPASVEQAEALAERGLEGDRYCSARPTQPPPGRVPTDVTLIESEAVAALEQDLGLTLEPALSRRNLLTRGVPLNHLVGREFLVGTVRLRGVELCEPCGHLERLTVPGIQQALCHRGGLRARIVTGGRLRVGDLVRPAPDS